MCVLYYCTYKACEYLPYSLAVASSSFHQRDCGACIRVSPMLLTAVVFPAKNCVHGIIAWPITRTHYCLPVTCVQPKYKGLSKPLLCVCWRWAYQKLIMRTRCSDMRLPPSGWRRTGRLSVYIDVLQPWTQRNNEHNPRTNTHAYWFRPRFSLFSLLKFIALFVSVPLFFICCLESKFVPFFLSLFADWR